MNRLATSIRVLGSITICIIGILWVSGCSQTSTDPDAYNGRIVGTVVRDTDKGSAQPLQISTRPATTSVIADASGKFELHGIPAGSYEVVADGGTEHGSTFVVVQAGKDSRADISVRQQDPFAAQVIGFIREVRSQEPLQGVTVRIAGTENVTSTDPFGRYVLYNVPPGTVVVKASHPGIGSISRSVACEAGRTVDCNITFRAHPEPKITNGLIAYYPLDRDAMDYGPNGFNGETFGDVSFGQGVDEPNYGAAFFDGKGDRIDVPHSEALNSTTMTITFWLKPRSDLSANAQLLGKSIDGSGDGYMVYRSLGRLSAGAFRSNYSQVAKTETLYTADEKWTHVACIFNGFRSEIWVNGIVQSVSNWNTSPQVMTSTAPFTIGGSLSTVVPAELVQGMSGWIDEVYVFDRVLSRNEIQSLISN